MPWPTISGVNLIEEGEGVPSSHLTATTVHGDATNLEKVANKGGVSGYAPLDSASKVPTVNLGGTGASNTKYLRGDQTWQVPAGGTAKESHIVMMALGVEQSF